MFNDEDKKIEECLGEMSNFDPKEKEEIWNNIEKELFIDEKKSKPPRQKKWGLLVAAAAATLFIAFSSQTDTGNALVDKMKTVFEPGTVSALVDKVKSMFEPKKEIVQSIEGIDEDTKLTLNEGKEAEYVIYIDEERYVMNRTDDGDIITPKIPLDAQYPEVSMAIRQQKDVPASSAFQKLKEDILRDYPYLILEEETNEPLSGFVLLAKKDGHDWDNELTKVYVLDNGAGGSFIIQQKYFSEAEEGHGTRFDAMLKEFHIVKD
ncbi:hypothetical protein J27TS8_10490 [Robertmurraya siralis]|uniref:Uncharacterized protein n=1 Tax=Robertmurraya siralis TaxID=77777 RepID=A0A920BSW0_9BACI|nr:hypothetical protein [Robertmurraya siralis]PAE22540.1 hypothetical protein CHH80_00835 [Bacillus sp. 7504-2]GIN61056.1 hypothetical protein J27TS8_10490 [Robertmurraya siralis]